MRLGVLRVGLVRLGLVVLRRERGTHDGGTVECKCIFCELLDGPEAFKGPACVLEVELHEQKRKVMKKRRNEKRWALLWAVLRTVKKQQVTTTGMSSVSGRAQRTSQQKNCPRFCSIKKGQG